MIQSSQARSTEAAETTPGDRPQGLFYVTYPAADRVHDAAALLAWADAEYLDTSDERLELTVAPSVVRIARRKAFRPEPGRNWQSKGPGGGPRGVIESWSENSRRNMMRAIAERDFSGSGWVMLTLTYPGDFLGVAPTAVRAKQHLAALRRRWGRAWGAPRAFWKQEFQARGAPHYHVLAQLPDGVELRVFRQWIARAWYEVVGSNDERHLRAGTAVDANRRTWDNAAAIGYYFSKHGVWDSKEYQHQPPPEWETTGRWWGAWNLPAVTETIDVDPASVVQVRRYLRRWFRSVHQPKLVLRACEQHGEQIVQRVGYIRPSLRSLKGRNNQGAWLLVRDGPRFALALGRAVGYVETMNGGTGDDEEKAEALA